MAPTSGGRRELARRLAAAVATMQPPGATADTRHGRRPRRLRRTTLTTWCAGRGASRSGSRRSRCESPRCSSGRSASTAIAGVLAFTLREALWLLRAGRQRRHRRRLPHGRPHRAGQAGGLARRRLRDHADGRRRRPPRRGRLRTPLPRRPDPGGDRRRRRPADRRPARRSEAVAPLRPGVVVVLARAIDERRGFRLVGVMTYEGQVAGRARRGPDPAGAVADRAWPQAGVADPAGGTTPRGRRGAGRRGRAGVLERGWLGLGRVDRAGPGRHRGGGGLRAARSRPCSTTTSPSSPGRRRSSRCPSYAARRPASPRSTAAGWSPRAQPDVTGCRCRGSPRDST